MTHTDQSYFLVTDFGHAGVVSAAWVRATSATEAAERGRIMLKQENSRDEQEYCETVAVVPAASPEWFEFKATASRCQFQCCGGTADTPDRHTGFCPEFRPDPDRPWREDELTTEDDVRRDTITAGGPS